MKPRIKNWIRSCFAIAPFILMHFGCQGNSTNPIESQGSELHFSDIRNVVWTLSAFEKAGHNVRISTFPPFHLIFDQEQFFGDDGCNQFGATYEAWNDSIIPGAISQTLRLCALIGTFPIQHLAEPYRLQITQSTLRIFVENNVYTYKSRVSDSIENSPLIGNWHLSASTDPESDEIQTQQLTPMLSFDEDREFRIIWSCSSDNPFGCDEISGIFGTGANGKILLYPMAWQHHQPGSEFVLKVLGSSSYLVKSDSPKGARLILVNESSGATFEFQSISRSGLKPNDGDTQT